MLEYYLQSLQTEVQTHLLLGVLEKKNVRGGWEPEKNGLLLASPNL